MYLFVRYLFQEYLKLLIVPENPSQFRNQFDTEPGAHNRALVLPIMRSRELMTLVKMSTVMPHMCIEIL